MIRRRRCRDATMEACKSHKPSKLTKSSTALPKSSFTTMWSNSAAAASSVRAVSNRRSRCSAVSVPRPTSRLTSSSQLRRSDEHRPGPRQPLPDLPGALQVDFENHPLPARHRFGNGGGRRAVAVPSVHDRPFQQPVGRDQPVELGTADEVVVDAVGFVRSRWTGGCRNRHPHLRMPCLQRLDDGSLSNCGGARDDGDVTAHRTRPSGRRVDAVRVRGSCGWLRCRTSPSPGWPACRRPAAAP